MLPCVCSVGRSQMTSKCGKNKKGATRGDSRLCHCCSWPTESRVYVVASQQQIQRTTMVYKSLHGLAPDYLCSKFERRETAYNLRDSENKLNVPLTRTNYYKNSFSYSGATLWNSLPRDVRQAKSFGLFKRLVKEVR